MPHVIIVAIITLLCMATKRYKKSEIGKPDRKEHPFRSLYPTAYWLLQKVFGRVIKKRDVFRREKLQAVYAAVNVDKAGVWYSCKVISFIIAIALTTNILAFCATVSLSGQKTLMDGRYLMRPEVNEPKEEVDLNIRFTGETDLNHQERLDVEARRFTEVEAKETITRVKEELPKVVLGENEKAERVQCPLNLIKNMYGIQIEWETDGKYVDMDGSLNNGGISEEGVRITLRAMLKYGDWEEETYLPVVLHAPNYTEEERLLRDLRDAIEAGDADSSTKETWELPKSVDGNVVSYGEKREDPAIIIVILGLLCLVGTPYLVSLDLENRLRRREREMKLDYPEVINKFTLLLGAGMTMKGAWGRIVAEYADKRKKGLCPSRYVYEEMWITWNEIANGQMERTAYERFGRRVKIAAYTKFITLVSQNLKKGNSRLLSILELGAVDAWEERKEAVKRLGEEASSKLLVPMILMFGIVLAVILYPAIMTM